MTVQIEVDDEVFDLLKARAEPLVDTPNTVLRRLLGFDAAAMSQPFAGVTATLPSRIREPGQTARRTPAKARHVRKRAPAGTLLPEERYELPILRALVQAGGRGPAKEITDVVGRELKDELTPLDFETLGSGGIRWQSRIQFVRLRLIERDLMDKNSPRGVWTISQAGQDYLQQQPAEGR